MINKEEQDFKNLLLKIKQNIGLDFSDYRLNCIKRRVDSRLRLHHLTTYREYIKFLEQNNHELELLIKTITIHFTNFFRDKSAWRVIEHEIIPLIIKEKVRKKIHKINIWSAGTSTGEEAYTLAILCHKILGNKINDFNIKIYGTDIDKHSLNKAVIGCYSPKSLRHVSAHILAHYFHFDGTHYHVNEIIRQMIYFKLHDLVNSTMRLTMDLIVCRNVFIYFSPMLQYKILERFSHTLQAGGFLMLGKMESLIFYKDLNFKNYNPAERIYQKPI